MDAWWVNKRNDGYNDEWMHVDMELLMDAIIDGWMEFWIGSIYE